MLSFFPNVLSLISILGKVVFPATFLKQSFYLTKNQAQSLIKYLTVLMGNYTQKPKQKK